MCRLLGQNACGPLSRGKGSRLKGGPFVHQLLGKSNRKKERKKPNCVKVNNFNDFQMKQKGRNVQRREFPGLAGKRGQHTQTRPQPGWDSTNGPIEHSTALRSAGRQGGSGACEGSGLWRGSLSRDLGGCAPRPFSVCPMCSIRTPCIFGLGRAPDRILCVYFLSLNKHVCEMLAF